MIERRRRARLRVDSVAFIITKTGNPVACRITDRSEDGARLSVDSILGIPNQFRLVIQRTGEAFPATVVWRGPQEIGVAFVEPQEAPASVRTPITIPLDPEVGLRAQEARINGGLAGTEYDA